MDTESADQRRRPRWRFERKPRCSGHFRDPSQVEVTVGGNAAPVTGTAATKSNAYNSAYPYPATTVTFTVPSGTIGAADLTVTTQDGSHTLSGGFHYIESLEDYSPPASGTTYRSLLFNPKRNEVYLSSDGRVDVFSSSSLGFTGSFNPAALNGKSLGGMAISPDGNTLYITDTSDGSLLVVDPTNLSAATAAISIAPASVSSNCLYGPVFVAVTSDSKAYITYDNTSSQNCSPSNIANSYLVNLNTGSVSIPSWGGMNCGGYFAASAEWNTVRSLSDRRVWIFLCL